MPETFDLSHDQNSKKNNWLENALSGLHCLENPNNWRLWKFMTFWKRSKSEIWHCHINTLLSLARKHASLFNLMLKAKHEPIFFHRLFVKWMWKAAFNWNWIFRYKALSASTYLFRHFWFNFKSLTSLYIWTFKTFTVIHITFLYW